MVGGHQADMEGWGVYSIFKEAGRLLYRHIRILRPFILAFLLPLSLILFLKVIGIAWFLTWVADQAQPHHFGDIVVTHHRHFGFHAFRAAFSKAPNPHDPVPVFVILLLVYALIFLISIISWLLLSLATAAIAKAIHHIYSSPNEDSTSSSQTLTQTQNPTQSIFTSLPHSLYRIFIISLCFFVVDILTYFLLYLPFYLFLSGPQFVPYHLQALHTLLMNLVLLIFDFWFLVSVQVVVLESEYDGWAALQRSARLVKAKAATALGLLAVYFVYLCVFNWALVVALVTPAHSVLPYVVAVAAAVGNLAFEAFWSVVATVFYFVSKRKGSGEEGRQAEGEHAYQALDVSGEN